MGRRLPFFWLIAFAVACGNPSRAPIDANDGSVVIPDGPATPGDFGADCTSHTDCESGYCVEPVGEHGGVCSRTCNDDCPQDWECHLVHLPQADVKLCVPAAKQLCLACANDTECGGGACLDIDGGGRCAIPCSGQCPTGYTCKADASGSHTGNWCQPVTDSCTCSAAMNGASRSCSEQATVGGNPATCFGTQTCSASGWSTCTANTPTAETCDGVDNDCNFIIDDGVGGGSSCNITNAAGTCVGVQQCTGSSGFTCVGQTPTAEMCDAIDNNCNGAVDETFVAAGLGSTCTAGVGACIRYGSQRCNSTQNGLVCSAVAGSPTAELCNQLDDDCNGVVDNGFTTGPTALGNVCTAGLGVCARGGTYVCASNGASTTCSATADLSQMTTETCNYLDDNCDGVVDNGFKNASTGFYDTDQNCGACGTNCTTMFSGATQAFGQCVVGTSPQCVMRCNTGYGNLNGSTLDGCEFQIDATAIYVSVADTTAVDDATCGLGPTGTGTGNHPCKSITQGLLRSSITGRTQILVADGTYNEGVMLLNGKQVKGGYRSDTWERHLSTTSTVISGSTQSGNHDRTVVAASITSATLFEGFVVRGSFNAKAGGNSYAIYITGSNSNLTIKDNQIFGGRGGSGGAGTPGQNGATGANGQAYVASSYDSFQTSGTVGTNSCDHANDRYNFGGVSNRCNGVDNSGGNGGGNNCTPVRSTQSSTSGYPSPPNPAYLATAGLPGGGTSPGAGGAAGTRGYDADLQNHTCLIPVQGSNGLPMFGSDGSPGGSGGPASGVGGCSAANGSIVGNDWVGGSAPVGLIGSSGGGGGGGGAGAGAHCVSCMIQMNQWKAGPDLLGAHGGGGGGGGCGGNGGGGGGPGGGTFGIFILGTSAPTITNNSITLGTGGSGGTGGIGGAGGLGGIGTKGGEQGAQAELFCTGKAGRGGDGGSGGAGSGGGGGCGGSTFGIFSSGIGNPNYCGSNTTTGGTVGGGGAGGFSGGNSGGTGANGVLQNCVAL